MEADLQNIIGSRPALPEEGRTWQRLRDEETNQQDSQEPGCFGHKVNRRMKKIGDVGWVQSQRLRILRDGTLS